MDLTKSLQNRFTAVTASQTESGFYQCVYEYLEFIFKSPKLNDLYKQIESDYRRKATEILDKYEGHPTPASARTEALGHMERTDTYSIICSLEMRVYYAVKHYRECENPSDNKDFVGSLLVNGLDQTVRIYKDDFFNSKKDIVSTYNNWFKGARNTYQDELNLFHMHFLTLIESSQGSITIPSVERTHYDEKGTLFLGNAKVRVNRRSEPTVEHYILKFMQENDGFSEPAYFSEILEEEFEQPKEDFRKILRACESLKKKIKEDSGLENILIYGSGITSTVTLLPPT